VAVAGAGWRQTLLPYGIEAAGWLCGLVRRSAVSGRLGTDWAPAVGAQQNEAKDVLGGAVGPSGDLLVLDVVEQSVVKPDVSMFPLARRSISDQDRSGYLAGGQTGASRTLLALRGPDAMKEVSGGGSR
jgi:hypothetical protein